MLSRRTSRWNLAHLFSAILFFGLLAMTARSAVDPDLWWHLRTGQQIVETGQVPRVDAFSFTRAGQAWISHEWLSELVFYEIWKLVGPAGLIVFASLVTTTGFMLLYFRCPRQPYWAAAATVVGALASAPAFGVRPQMFTFAFSSLLLWLLQRGEERPQLLFWIPPLFLLWLNLHAGFAMGAALLIAFGAGLMWESVSGQTPWAQARPIVIRLLSILLACAVLVPLNPSGLELYRYPLDVLRSATMRSFIVEWFPPDFHQFRYSPLLVVCLLLLAAFASSRCRPSARVLFPLLGTLLAALDAVRHIPIFMLVAMPVIAGAGPEAAPARQVTRESRRAATVGFRIAFLAVVAMLMAIFALARCVDLVRRQETTEAELFPLRAVNVLDSSGFGQPLFAYYDWGGYVVWKLYPRTQVFVDGRADLYGAALLKQFKTAVEVRDGWQQIFADWGVDAILVPPNCALAQALALDARWESPYRDSRAILFLRVAPAVLDGQARRNLTSAEKIFRISPLNLRN